MSRSHHILFFLIILGILLPSAPQAILSGIVGLRFLFLRAWRPLLNAWPDRPSLKNLNFTFAVLWKGWLLLLSAQILLMLCQLMKSALDQSSLTLTLSSHLRLLGKQGLYGGFIILTFILAGQVFLTTRKKIFTWHSKGILVACFTLGLYMFAQRYWGWDWVHGWNAQLGDNRFAYGVYRASGFMGHPLTMAYNCMVLSLFAFAHGIWIWQRERQESWVWLAISAVSVGLIALTGSRYPLVLTLILMTLSLFTMWLQSRSQKGLGILLSGILLMSTVFLFDGNMVGRLSELVDPQIPMESRFDRLIFWKVHLLLAKDHLWFGTGLVNYDRLLLDYYDQAGYTHIERKYSAHNIILQTLADLGLCGLLVLIILFTVWLWAALRINKEFRHQGFLLLWLGTLLSGMMQNNLRDSEYLYALWTSLGLCCGCLLAGGLRNEPDSRSHLQDHQPGTDLTYRRPDV